MMNKFPMFSGAVPLDDRGILDALRGSDIVKKATAERATSVLALRTAAASKCAKLVADADDRFPKMRAQLEVAIRDARAAEIAWRQKADRTYEIQSQLSAESSTFTIKLADMERQLAETSCPEIVPFIADMWAMWEDCFKRFAFEHSVVATSFLGPKNNVTRNNKKSVQARQSAIRSAIDAAEAMRLEPDQSTVPAQLQELRQNLPTIKGL